MRRGGFGDLAAHVSCRVVPRSPTELERATVVPTIAADVPGCERLQPRTGPPCRLVQSLPNRFLSRSKPDAVRDTVSCLYFAGHSTGDPAMNRRARTRRRNRRIFTRMLCSFLLGLSACSLADALTEMTRAEIAIHQGAVFCVLCPAILAALLMLVTLFADGFSIVRRKKTAWEANLPMARGARGETWNEQGDAVTVCGSC